MLNLGFLPRSTDLGILFLRVTLGCSMLVLHGWDKLVHFPDMVKTFPDPLGLGSYLSLSLAMVLEIVCSLLLIGGLLTRFAAASLLLLMAVAVFGVYHSDFTVPGAQLAAAYGFGFGAVVLSGGGVFSADAASGPYALAGFGAVTGFLGGYPLSYLFQGSAFQASVPFSQYSTGIGNFATTDPTRVTALTVWVVLTLAAAAAGYAIGRLMNQERVRVAPSQKSIPTAD